MQSATKEEKQLESSVDALIQRVQEVKASIVSFLMKLEHEHQTVNWPSMLDNFSLLSGQINTLQKLVKSDKMPVLRNQIVLPLALAQERDAEVEKLSEGRVMAFNHEVVPDYLRTKPVPELDEKHTQVNNVAAKLLPDMVMKQIATLNKISSSVYDMVTTTRDEWESESNQKSQLQQTTSQADTHELMAAVTYGKNLKATGRQSGPRAQPGPPPPAQQPVPTPTVNINKAPSTIKTNIKSASSVHPYSRP